MNPLGEVTGQAPIGEFDRALMEEAITLIDELRRERNSARTALDDVQKLTIRLYDALELLVEDVRDYPAWNRPCHALDMAKAAIAAFNGEEE